MQIKCVLLDEINKTKVAQLFGGNPHMLCGYIPAKVTWRLLSCSLSDLHPWVV